MTGALRQPGGILLVSCYELGHQPLGVAWPRAFLERAGYAPETLDLAVEPFDADKARRARIVAISVPMHTALRLGVRAAERVRCVNATCRIVFYGLYALLNAEYLRAHGADAVLGGELEQELVALVRHWDAGGEPAIEPRPALERLPFPPPSRVGLPALTRYASLARGRDLVPAGYVEASRGCLHTCLHCPVPAVYGGRFFIVPRDVVLTDIRGLVAAGAGHITFGDPDFLNGPGHAVKLVRALHDEFPHVSYDFTAKIEHVLEQQRLFPEFGATGCAFVVSAVESLSDTVLTHLDKGHTKADVIVALAILRAAGIPLRPSFVPFTPWSALRCPRRPVGSRRLPSGRFRPGSRSRGFAERSRRRARLALWSGKRGDGGDGTAPLRAQPVAQQRGELGSSSTIKTRAEERIATDGMVAPKGLRLRSCGFPGAAEFGGAMPSAGVARQAGRPPRLPPRRPV